MDKTTFGYLQPTDEQKRDMEFCRQGAKAYAEILETYVPAGADRTYLLRKLREVAMWANVAITRDGDGAPRG